MLKPPNKVEKLKISAFKKAKRKGSSEDFEFLINPGTINSKHENRFSRSKGINTSGRSAPYAFSSSDEMALELTIDNTFKKDKLPGLLLKSADPVKEQVDDFLAHCFYMDGDIHEPRFLLLEWGKFAFECRLKSVEVGYSHFNAKGEPLRAKLKTVFVADMPTVKRIRLENKKSPDITHKKIVVQGDTLTGLCKDIYGDASHYLMVAQFNKLDHFRNLHPGTQLQFPPLEK